MIIDLYNNSNKNANKDEIYEKIYDYFMQNYFLNNYASQDCIVDKGNSFLGSNIEYSCFTPNKMR